MVITQPKERSKFHVESSEVISKRHNGWLFVNVTLQHGIEVEHGTTNDKDAFD